MSRLSILALFLFVSLVLSDTPVTPAQSSFGITSDTVDALSSLGYHVEQRADGSMTAVRGPRPAGQGDIPAPPQHTFDPPTGAETGDGAEKGTNTTLASASRPAGTAAAVPSTVAAAAYGWDTQAADASATAYVPATAPATLSVPQATATSISLSLSTTAPTASATSKATHATSGASQQEAASVWMGMVIGWMLVGVALVV
ncbi:hypothetical protein ACQY0O_005001 [Thecaphora frezii]